METKLSGTQGMKYIPDRRFARRAKTHRVTVVMFGNLSDRGGAIVAEKPALRTAPINKLFVEV
jgi:hypothetical protein